ncbi:MAG: DsrE family protein [Oscillospiraceae bacterium]
MEPKVIFHIDEMQKWRVLLNNVANLLMSYDGLSPDAKIEVLANSEAVKGYLPDHIADDLRAMDALVQKGVRFVACQNALNGMKISREQIVPFADVVPAGVRELADRQMAGYAYIKP